MSKVDKLKERLSHFINEYTITSKEVELKIPERVTNGFKLDVIPQIIIDVFRLIHKKELKYISYEKVGQTEYLFKFIMI